MQARILIAAALLLVSFACGLFLGVKWGKANGASEQVRLLSEKADAVLADAAKTRAQAEKLQKALDALPKSEGKIREVVRQSPSKCDRPAVVADRVREAARESNASRKVPSDF